ncbi:carbon-nitrogen hydrolase family protein [Enhygromyxa salina]|uniref:carbon-nitrogen hydrolase family protein n=1 Tax=Enhygromyxa salina TaxID=215803 RepID=UPI000697A19C|nr:carbon-nitrogen hydrolase family protein [Enhygromyxa salina]
MTPFAIAGVQMSLSAIHSNVDRMITRLSVLMQIYPWVQMVVFSELAPFGPLIANAKTFPCDTEARFQELAARHKIWLLPGSMFEREGDTIYNTASVIDPAGNVVGRYRKMFPFYPYEQGVTGGNDFLVFDVPDVGRFGVSICYDMWIPETSRTLAAMGAEVILHPTLTSSIDRDVELAIARATAAQQQCFFFDVNGLGDGGIGQSIVIGPNGDPLHRCGAGEVLFPIEIDVSRVRRTRELGLKGLGQPLKSFRDRTVRFPVYEDTWREQGYFAGLGPLQKPVRNEPLPHPGPFARTRNPQ